MFSVKCEGHWLRTKGRAEEQEVISHAEEERKPGWRSAVRLPMLSAHVTCVVPNRGGSSTMHCVHLQYSASQL